MNRAAKRVAILLAVTAAAAVFAGPASGAYVHTTVTGEYGKEGPAASGLGGGCRIAWQASSERLYVLADGKVFGLHRTAPGAVSPLAGNFPVDLGGINSHCGDPDIAVDNSSTSSKGRFYVTPSNPGTIFGYDANGIALPEPWPVTTGTGETCGVAVAANGDVLGGNYGGQQVTRLTSAGSPLAPVPMGYSLCKIEIDQTNGNLFVHQYGGVFQRIDAPGYTARKDFPSSGTSNPGIAVAGSQHRVYVANGSNQVRAYDTVSGSLIETIDTGSPVSDVAVDEATDTLFTAGGVIKEIKGAVVPDLTTGTPTGTATMHGHVEPAGGGDVTSCEFEFSQEESYTGPTTGSVPCEPSIPPNYSGPTDVTADLNGQIEGEKLYHFRLVAGNANGVNRSADSTFIPHFVAELKTGPATAITRKAATLNASYQGNGEATEVYFKWGPSLPYANSTPVQVMPGSNVVTDVTAALGDVLEPGTTYHFAVVAKNGQGTSQAQDETFTTKPSVTDLLTKPATNVGTTTADLNASFTGDGLDTTYWFEYGSSSLYGNETAKATITAPSGSTAVPATPIDGLQPLHTYHFRVVAENSFGLTYGPDVVLTTFSAPITVAQSTSKVTATSATLHAVIHPHGADTKYHFEYGTSASYGSSAPIPDALIPAGEDPVDVKVELTGLNGGVYHFSVVAESKYGTTRSKDQTFNFYPPVCPNATVRQQTGANTLPDCRAYELVTPEDQGITIVYAANAPFSPTATSPSRLGFVGAFGLIPDSGEPANNQGDVYVATRTSTGWKTKFVGIPSSQASLAGGPPWLIPRYEPDKFQENTLWNQDLSAFVQWDNGIFHIGELYESLHEKRSNAPYVYDTGTGRQLDRWPSNVGAIPGGQYFEGRTNASADLSHYVFTSDIPFAPGGISGDMYDNDTETGETEVISYYPDGETHIPDTFPLAVSENGSHILMVQRKAGPGEQVPIKGDGPLFVRTGGETIELAGGKTVRFVGQTPDGRKVYFSSKDKLLAEDTDTSRDLYMWEQGSANPGELTQVSKGNEPTAGNTDGCSAGWTTACDIVPISFETYTSSQGGRGGYIRSENFIAAENGDIYYLSPEQLHGANGVAGMENLYVFRNGKNQFVAALDPAGIPCTKQQGSDICAETAIGRMEVTPDNSHMAFLTASNVTDYDSEGHSEMYLYRPAAEEIECVSCVPTGEPPQFDVTGSHNGRYLTDDGRTFFETKDPLVPPDTNAAADVYEYVEGRPQLITSGTNVGNDSMGLATIMALPGLVGVSADGIDVYIATYDTLVGQDRNGEAVKIYDARSSGGFQFNAPVPPCVAADECHGPSTEAPATPVSGTGTHLGDVGNHKPQAKKGKNKKAAKKAKKKKRKRKSQKRGRGQ